jgi:uncharacterized phage protein
MKTLTDEQRLKAAAAARSVRFMLVQLRAIATDLCQIEHPEEVHLLDYAIEGLDSAADYLKTYEGRALSFSAMELICPRCEGERKRLRPGDDECWVCKGRGSVTKQVFDVQKGELDT